MAARLEVKMVCGQKLLPMDRDGKADGCSDARVFSQACIGSSILFKTNVALQAKATPTARLSAGLSCCTAPSARRTLSVRAGTRPSTGLQSRDDQPGSGSG